MNAPIVSNSISGAERMSRLDAGDHIRKLVDRYTLPAPAIVQFSPGVHGTLALFTDTDAERDAWVSTIGTGGAICGHPTAVLSLEAARAATAGRACRSCGGGVVHQTGCPAVDLDTAPECVGCGALNGSHQSHCFAAAAQIPVAVITVSPGDVPEHLADHFAVLNPDAPIPYVPVPMPTGVQANRDECARLNGETVHHVPTDAHLRHEPSWHSDHLRRPQHEVKIVDVVTVDPYLTAEGRGDPGMAHLMAVQTSFAEAADRMAVERDAEITRLAEALVVDVAE